MTTRYLFFVNDKGYYIGRDRYHGYPFETKNIFDAYAFNAEYEAKRYYDGITEFFLEFPFASYVSNTSTWTLMEFESMQLKPVTESEWKKEHG